MFLHFKNANTMHLKKSLYSIVVKKMYTKMSSVHGSSVLTVSPSVALPSSPFLFSKHSNICFAIIFCILTFPLGGFIRNMNILLGDILLIFILYSFSLCTALNPCLECNIL